MKYKIWLIFILFLSQSLFSSIDLDEFIADFVLETEQIKVPNYPLIFNPSIVRWHNKFLMAFRIREGKSTQKIGLTWLDDNFQPGGEAYILKIEAKEVPLFMQQKGGPTYQDPRLIVINDQLYIVYSHYQVGKMFVAEMVFKNNTFIAQKPDCLLKFDGALSTKREKNWVPFEYNDELFLAYSLLPHKILKPVRGSDFCQTVTVTKNEFAWDWGELRGGTPALKIDDDHYLGFFHSSQELVTQQSSKKALHYFMGAYLFSASFPFEIIAMSSEPIVSKNFYETPKYSLYKPLRVVFPGGFVYNDEFIWVFYGRHDNEVWYAKIDKAGLYASLQEVDDKKVEL